MAARVPVPPAPLRKARPGDRKAQEVRRDLVHLDQEPVELGDRDAILDALADLLVADLRRRRESGP